MSHDPLDHVNKAWRQLTVMALCNTQTHTHTTHRERERDFIHTLSSVHMKTIVHR